MVKISKNLGIVSAIHIGTTAPTNIYLLWYNISDGFHYYFDTITEGWVKLKSEGGGEGLSATLAIENITDGNDIKISTASGDSIVFVNAAQTRSISLVANPSVGNFTQTFQDKSGTIALTSDIPGTLYTGSGILSGPTVVDGTISTHNLAFANIGEWGVAAEEIVLGSNNYILLNGTIGIGVATPTSKVEIKGAGATSSTSSLVVVNSSDIETFRIKDNVSIDIGGGNGTNSTVSIRQHNYTVNSNVLDIYGYDQAKHLVFISDDGASTGSILLNGGDWGCNIYTNTYGIGVSPGTTKLAVRHNDTGDILAVIPVGGSGGFYVAAGVDNNPHIYLQDNLGVATNLLLSSNGDSYVNGGSFGIGTVSVDASVLLELSSTSKGFAPPSMTGAQVEAISTPKESLIVYATNAGSGDITTKGWWGWGGSNWIQLG